MNLKILTLITLLISSLSFADTTELQEGSFTIRAVDAVETNDSIIVYQPHTIVNEKTSRFSISRMTQTGLCHLLISGREISIVESGFSSDRTLFLDFDGNVIRQGESFRSLFFVKCLKDD